MGNLFGIYGKCMGKGKSFERSHHILNLVGGNLESYRNSLKSVLMGTLSLPLKATTSPHNFGFSTKSGQVTLLDMTLLWIWDLSNFLFNVDNI